MNHRHPEPDTTRLVLSAWKGWLRKRWPRIASIASSIASKRFCFACRSILANFRDFFAGHVQGKHGPWFSDGFLHIKCWVFPLCFTIFSPFSVASFTSTCHVHRPARLARLAPSGWPGWDLHRINSYGPKKGLYLLWVQLPTAKLMFFVF